MSETKAHLDVMPSAVPTDADRVAWSRLSREEQLQRLRLSLAQSECSTASASSMDDILKRAQASAHKHRG